MSGARAQHHGPGASCHWTPETSFRVAGQQAGPWEQSSEVSTGLSIRLPEHQPEQQDGIRKCFSFGSRGQMENTRIFLHLEADLGKASSQGFFFAVKKWLFPHGQGAVCIGGPQDVRWLWVLPQQ